MSDLNILIPDKEVELRGRTITVRPFPLRKLPVILALVDAYFPVFADGEYNGINIIRALLNKVEGGDYPVLDHLEKVIEAACAGIDCEHLTIDEAAILLKAIWEQNSDFFARMFPATEQPPQSENGSLQNSADYSELVNQSQEQLVTASPGE